MRCTNRSGAYRCMFEAGHAPPCEAQSPEYRKAHDVEPTIESIREQIRELEAIIASHGYDLDNVPIK